MRKLCLRLIPILLVSFSMADSVYVHSAKAPLLSEAQFNADTVIMLERGTQLTLVEKQKRWVKVQLGENTGWVSVLLVKNDPPIEKVDILGTESVNLEGEARVRASAVATAGATRGLTEGEEPGGLQSDYSELVKMESITISLDKVNAFALSVLGGNQP